MLDLEGIKTQIRFFECFDSAVTAYKMMSDGTADSFFDAVKRQNKIPLINSIPGSNVLLVNHVLKTAITRYALMMYVREEESFIKFDKIQNESDYISVRDKILQADPSLTQAECNKVLKQICNAIAHGDILSSLDFEIYENMITDIYKRSGSLIAKHPDMAKKYYDGHIASSRLKFNYETFFDILPDGTRVKRPHPIKRQLDLKHDDISKIVYLISDNTNTNPVAFYVNSDHNIEILDISDNEEKMHETYILDETQKEALQEMKAEFMDEYGEIFKTDFNEKMAITMAISRILLGDKFKYLKLRELCDVGATVAKGIKETKRTADEIQEQIFDMFKSKIANSPIYKVVENGHEIVSKDLNLSMRTVLNAEIGNIYKNFLIIEVVSMLQIVEQNELKRLVGNSDIIREIATDYYKKEELTDKEILKVIDHIRDAFIHGTFINNVDDKIEIYDQVSRSDKTLEYKFTVYNDDLEKIKEACFVAFRQLKRNMESILPTTTPTTTKTTPTTSEKERTI